MDALDQFVALVRDRQTLEQDFAALIRPNIFSLMKVSQATRIFQFHKKTHWKWIETSRIRAYVRSGSYMIHPEDQYSEANRND